jgi:Putative restriction endonuclease
MVQQLLPTESLPTEEITLDISHIDTEDDTPVDNFQSAKQQRLLVEPLYSSEIFSSPFIADANVGIFFALKKDPVVPDVFLSLEVEMPEDYSKKQNRSYFVWEFGKVPEVCIEVVSNRKGREIAKADAAVQSQESEESDLENTPPKEIKKDIYARIGVVYYAVFDPLRQIQEPSQMNGELLRVWTLLSGKYVELTFPFWLETVGLGLTLWEGEFEDSSGIWLRWCDRDGQVVPTGKERADREQLRAEQEKQRAEQEKQRAEQEKQRADRLAAQLRAAGIEPEA